MAQVRLRAIGARCPIGTKMPAGRRAGVGGIGASPRAPGVRLVLPVHGQFARSRGFEPGSFFEGVQVIGELPLGGRRISDVVDERDAQFAGGSLPANEARPADGFDRGRNTAGRRKARVEPHAVQARGRFGIERADTAGALAAFAGLARGGNPAGLAGSGIQRNSSGFVGARRNGKIEN